MNALVLRGVRAVDARGERHGRADVLIEGDRIVAVEPTLGEISDAEELDLTGTTVVPGLMNAHTHVCLDGSADPAAVLAAEDPVETAVRSERRLRETVERGVTTIRDLGGPAGIDIALSRLLASGEIPGPRMLTAGRVITITGGHGNWMGAESDGPDAVRRSARAQIKAGASAIKLMATGGMMTTGQVAGAPQLTRDEMEAAVEVAHAVGLPVAAHAEGDEGARNAVLAGVDSIEHGHGMSRETVALMAERGVALVPTIQSDRAIIDAPAAAGIPDYVVEACVRLAPSLEQALALAIEGGVTIVAGNDGGAPLVHPGDIVSELELLVARGLSARDALTAATVNAAKLFRLPDLGLIEPGQIADLLVVRGDPLADVGSLRDPMVVIARGGRV
jgi:imidazolonepropionase-like amidohydrolase